MGSQAAMVLGLTFAFLSVAGCGSKQEFARQAVATNSTTASGQNSPEKPPTPPTRQNDPVTEKTAPAPPLTPVPKQQQGYAIIGAKAEALFAEGKFEEAGELWREIRDRYPRDEFRRLRDDDPARKEWKIAFCKASIRAAIAKKYHTLQLHQDQAATLNESLFAEVVREKDALLPFASEEHNRVLIDAVDNLKYPAGAEKANAIYKLDREALNMAANQRKATDATNMLFEAVKPHVKSKASDCTTDEAYALAVVYVRIATIIGKSKDEGLIMNYINAAKAYSARAGLKDYDYLAWQERISSETKRAYTGANWDKGK